VVRRKPIRSSSRRFGHLAAGRQALLGVAGYSLDARRLAAATIVLCVVAIFFDLAVSQGLSSGVEGYDRGSPSREAPRPEPGSGELG
jgi:hypothetical protein